MFDLLFSRRPTEYLSIDLVETNLVYPSINSVKTTISHYKLLVSNQDFVIISPLLTILSKDKKDIFGYYYL